MKRISILVLALLTVVGCKEVNQVNEVRTTSFSWNSATIYFLLPDRFYNADHTNDLNFERTKEAAVLRGFEGGDLKGITKKINEGYFTNLGINAIWFTPVVEQIHDATDEGTGLTYGYHGYWAKDWTSIDPNFGDFNDLQELVETAHQKGIRIILDVVANHTGPVTAIDPVWPSDWVRTEPACDYSNYEMTTACTLVENLPDILTESNQEVALPEALISKWKAEGRYEQELKELESYFSKTGYKRTPNAYLVKWLTDYVRELGIDGYRVDTAKHASENVWVMLREQADQAFATWKEENPSKVLDQTPFYMTGEVSGYTISNGLSYDFGDKIVDYYNNAGFNSLINFGLKNEADQPYEEIFSKYNDILHNELKGYSVLNFLSSHDEAHPYDSTRAKSFRAANVLLLTPGASQVYYGDESNRPLKVAGAIGDANLRSLMNWEDIENDIAIQENLVHWQKVGKFRANHPAIGAGHHQMLSESPYSFSRILNQDKVIIGLDLSIGIKSITVGSVFADGVLVTDAYSGNSAVVKNGTVEIDSPYSLVLLSE